MRFLLFYRTFVSMEELSVDYERGYLNSADVKMALEKAINNILEVTYIYCSLKSYGPNG
jgi:hypothetical protein